MIALCLLCLCGCGGGGSLVGGGSGSSGGLGGPLGGGGGGTSVSIQVNFPPQGTIAADIPAGTTTIAIDVVAGSDRFPEVPTTRFQRQGGATQSATIGHLLPGPTTFVAVAYDAGDTVLASGTAIATLHGGDNLIDLTLAPPGGGGPPSPVTLQVVPASAENDGVVTQLVETTVSFSGPFVPGLYAVTLPSGGADGLLANSTDLLDTTESYAFGGPSVTEAGSFSGLPYLMVAPGYGLDLPVPGGQETGSYTVHLNGQTAQVVSTTPYPLVPRILAPAEGSAVNFSNPVAVSWNSVGSQVGYLLQAQVIIVDTDIVTRWWSSVDLQTVDWSDPSEANAFIQALPDTTSAVIPAGAIPPGAQNVHIQVVAFPKAAVHIQPGSPVTQLLYARGEDTNVVNLP